MIHRSVAAGGTIRAKVVLVGAPGVGKTSLVRRFVHQVFTDNYRSTLGVKVDRKTVTVDNHDVVMLLWDTHGETEGLSVPTSYLKGAAAVLAVFDVTDPETEILARTLVDRLRSASPSARVWFAGNKSDLVGIGESAAQSMPAISAKTGDGVEELFASIARSLAAVER